MIDSHCHPNSKELELNAAEIMERAYSSGVESFMIVGCDLEDSLKALSMANNFKNYNAYAAVGIHPHEAKIYADNLDFYLDK
ncbi:MAG: TatD family hydrolase, partial [Synergistaceae bacterium]|nr:TatD family hydrolase [Synergistaceae bacterium]